MNVNGNVVGRIAKLGLDSFKPLRVTPCLHAFPQIFKPFWSQENVNVNGRTFVAMSMERIAAHDTIVNSFSLEAPSQFRHGKPTRSMLPPKLKWRKELHVLPTGGVMIREKTLVVALVNLVNIFRVSSSREER